MPRISVNLSCMMSMKRFPDHFQSCLPIISNDPRLMGLATDSLPHLSSFVGVRWANWMDEPATWNGVGCGFTASPPFWNDDSNDTHCQGSQGNRLKRAVNLLLLIVDSLQES